jgi:hypothetical protein
MLEKVTVVDRIEILEDGAIQVRRATYVTEDGVRITEPIYARAAYAPGESVEEEHARVQAVAASVWTKDVVEASQAARAVTAARA